MTNNLILGRHYESNKNVPLQCDVNGHLSTKTKLMDERSNARAFVYSANINFTGSSSDKYLISIFNPSGSTVKVAIYSVKCEISANASTSQNLVYRLRTITAAAGGTLENTNCVNLKLGHSTPNTNAVEIRKNPSTYTVGNDLDIQSTRTSSSSSDIDVKFVNQFYH